jgi:hypothetical protein
MQELTDKQTFIHLAVPLTICPVIQEFICLLSIHSFLYHHSSLVHLPIRAFSHLSLHSEIESLHVSVLLTNPLLSTQPSHHRTKYIYFLMG